jgi:glycosyltransferase involved in cell wall biosynthesis
MLARRNPALVHAHFGPDACNAIELAGSLQVPLVVTFHGYDITMSDRHMPHLYVQRRERLKIAGARFLCVSNFIRDRVIAKGFPASKALVHYTGIDTEFFTPEPAIERSPIVLFVGRLVAKKGCEYLIRAMARVQETLPEARLVIIGDGHLRAQLQLQARTLLKSFQFVGVQQPASVKNWMNRARVFSTPSVTAESGDAEGFGMVFSEAQAMGLPVVSFASGGIPEAVADGQTGLLVPEKDSTALADSILLLFRERELWSRFSEAGRARAKALFDLRKQASLLEGVYDSVLAESGSTAGLPVKERKAALAVDSTPL